MLIKKRLYVDMDGVLVNFVSALPHLSPEVQQEFDGRLDEVPDIFGLMEPMPGAIEAYHVLADLFDTYILSTAPVGESLRVVGQSGVGQTASWHRGAQATHPDASQAPESRRFPH